jgi:hypothetical protein
MKTATARRVNGEIPAQHIEVSHLQLHHQPDGRVVLEVEVWGEGMRSRRVLVRLAKHAYADLEFCLLRNYEGYITGREKARRA